MAEDDAVTLNRASRVSPHSTKTVSSTVSAVVRRPMLKATQAGARPKEICAASHVVSPSVRKHKRDKIYMYITSGDVRDQPGNPTPGPSYCSSCATARRGRP